MRTDVYIQGQKLEQFDDETITINRSVKTISDISKVFTDFTQSFTVPASPNNNAIFSHWYNSDIDNGFNALLRVDGHIEVNTLPYKFGSVQLNSVKMKNGLPYAYDITFFGKTVNLSDLVGEDLLSSLDLSDCDHAYNETEVLDSMNSNSITSGDVYYPLINAIQEMSIGNGGATDLIDSGNGISYRDFKPALRHLRIIEAIETKYSVDFSRIFFDRAIFYNYFLWLSKKEGQLFANGSIYEIDLTSVGTFSPPFADVNLTTNEIIYEPYGSGSFKKFIVNIIPVTGFETVEYTVYLNRNGATEYSFEETRVGASSLVYDGGIGGEFNILVASISATADFQFTSQVIVFSGLTTQSATNAAQTITSTLSVAGQMPELKIKDYLSSLIAEFNLIVEYGNGVFDFDTLDNWYSKGLFYDITKYVNIDEITIKKPDAKKKINFNYQKAGAILGDEYFANNNIGYGDLKAEYAINGSELSIESKFENLLFERLSNETTGDLTDIQVGFSIDKNLKPYKGAPYSFYKNGFVYSVDDIYISGKVFTKLQHTATEDNLQFNQITNSLNFGSDNSTFFLTPIEKGLYFNFYKNYIEDLYNPKTRVISLKCYLPISTIYKLNLNDKIIISDKKYKISSYQINLTTRETTFELFTDLGSPADSFADTIPLTVDTTSITVDSTTITVDSVSTHVPLVTYIDNGLSAESYLSTASSESFEIKINANTNWSISKVDTGDGITWFDSNKVLGNSSYYIRVSLLENTSGINRQGQITVTIGGVDFDLTILQLA